MLKKIGRILVLAIVMTVGTFAGTLISTICMSIIENVGKIAMTEYFEISMSGSIGILFGTGMLLLYMKKKIHGMEFGIQRKSYRFKRCAFMLFLS
ncbi:MAG: hypothetical protein HDR01_14920 [Lachnospiraceae bacterium]|nr:hypothetical protein [Lachnospiraceae bacterium]